MYQRFLQQSIKNGIQSLYIESGNFVGTLWGTKNRQVST